jgi:hypothetical protein
MTNPRDQHPPETVAYTEAVVDVARLTKRVRDLEAQLAAAQEDRKQAVRRAAELGVSFYRISKAADTSPASATRIVRDQ